MEKENRGFVARKIVDCKTQDGKQFYKVGPLYLSICLCCVLSSCK